MSRGHANRVRIIGGEHKGRRLDFATVKGLRPTADRVRETLFNWLQSELAGSRCLDLFAGSGALGLEALSRGAGFVLLCDQARVVVERLRANLETLDTGKRGEVLLRDARKLLASAPEQSFDIVFLDPPFAAGLLGGTAHALEGHSWLSDEAWIYLEQDASHPWPELPANWQLHREGRAGQAAFRLMRRHRSSNAAARAVTTD